MLQYFIFLLDFKIMSEREMTLTNWVCLRIKVIHKVGQAQGVGCLSNRND